ncbi:hypothetical protein [Atopococcus tabaci]|uniref:hypothetical protein n=1 Tax=Atopococcus tabaci TaxID=269774 RepID=UPI0024091695|nr:hypothetical protein [Atopococcus tabaci]
MAYADASYYKDEYGGIEVNNDLLPKLLKRASRDIDSLTGFSIDFEKLSERNQNLVKDAVCAQAEFLATNGETASTVAESGGSFSIGSYSENSGSTTKPTLYAANVKRYLFPTGLLYSGGVMLRG